MRLPSGDRAGGPGRRARRLGAAGRGSGPPARSRRADNLRVGDSDDTPSGDPEADRLPGEGGDDALLGGTGRDLLTGARGGRPPRLRGLRGRGALAGAITDHSRPARDRMDLPALDPALVWGASMGARQVRRAAFGHSLLVETAGGGVADDAVVVAASPRSRPPT